MAWLGLNFPGWGVPRCIYVLMSAVISLCVDEEQKARLDALARSTGRPVAFYLREAVDRYLDEQEYLDTLRAEAEAVRRGDLRTISLEQLEVECGLGD